MRLRRAAVAAALAATALLGIAGSAYAAPVWRDGGQIQSELFTAQSELLLGGPGSTVDRVDRARRLYRGELARRLRVDAPAFDRAVRRALRKARAAALRRDETGLAAARGSLRAALLGGAYGVTIAAATRRDAQTAEDWLLLREFRRTTRFTRPGIDATNAVKGLDSAKSSPRATVLAVKKDLLDAYQSRLLDALNDAEAADKRDFGPRRAEEAAQAAGYWQILAAEYRRQLGAEASKSAAATFTALDREAAAGGPRFEEALAARARSCTASRRAVHRGRAGAPRHPAGALPRPGARSSTAAASRAGGSPSRSRSRRRSRSATAPSPPSPTSRRRSPAATSATPRSWRARSSSSR